MGASMKGTREMRAKIQAVRDQFPEKVRNAVLSVAQEELEEAQRRCPVDMRTNAPHPGALRDSGTVTMTESANRTQAAITFGGISEMYPGVDVDYAVIVHEDLEAHHEVGQAKFLESTLDESAPFILQRIGAKLKL
jgi:hypothetical protein